MIRTSAPWRWAIDVILALMLGVAGQIQLVVPNDDGYFDGPHAASVVLMALTALPLVLRRVFPVQVALVVFGVHIVPSLVIAHSVTFWGTILPMAVALYSAARWGAGRFTPALLALPFAFILTYGIHVEEFNTWDEFVFTALLMGSAWAAWPRHPAPDVAAARAGRGVAAARGPRAGTPTAGAARGAHADRSGDARRRRARGQRDGRAGRRSADGAGRVRHRGTRVPARRRGDRPAGAG
jgi:hypothetical protein